MNNRNMPASPIFSSEGQATHSSQIEGSIGAGLTKLEYAAILICAGGQAIPGSHNRPEQAAIEAVEKAMALFDELEKVKP